MKKKIILIISSLLIVLTIKFYYDYNRYNQKEKALDEAFKIEFYKKDQDAYSITMEEYRIWKIR